MADTMEGVVTEADQPKPENVEQKTVAGRSLVILST
jgi:26S proteasome regulatory subunit N3